ncbi:arylsulfotransferase ASST [Albidovulum inexpectatum]|uniref:Arylsulfotransferase ASST n=1 Tax=Albidovulum inexpectatum TaxID=196587 RepID=A0A2S5JJ87_9RHOB|nr:arylsulfotransferase family protein [Albidovulum inexpectatum]PPB81576.1 arylsulfotransferase ASST [Albidovulum inexpectatum]
MHRFLFRQIPLWVILLLLPALVPAAVVFGAMVLDGADDGHRFGKASGIALTLAEVPDTMRALMRGDDPMEAFVSDRFGDKPPGWSLDKAVQLPGFVLLSRHDGDLGRHVIELVSLGDGKVRHRWVPDAETFLRDAPRSSRIAEYTNWTNHRYRAIHPILTDDALLVIKDHQSFMVALDACSRPVWVQFNELVHHSTETDGQGGFWVPGYVEPSEIKGAPADFVEDAILHLGPGGEVLDKRSLARILMRNVLEHALFTAGRYQKDPIHLNDIQPVLADGPHWRKGDLFLSARHLSMVMLYRPSEDRIIWMQQGPWLAQHDVDILDDHRIAIFNNRAYDRGTGARVHGTNQITVHDFDSGETYNPWAQAMERPDIKTLFEGLFTVLLNDMLMVEEENSGRVLIVTRQGDIVAEYVNKNSDGRIYRLGWSRYLDPEQGKAFLDKIAHTDCATPLASAQPR